MKVSEAQWQQQVIQMAQVFRWKVAHFRPSLNQRGKWQTAVQANGSGFPDLVLVHRDSGDLIFVELKSESGKVSDEQRDWLDLLDLLVTSGPHASCKCRVDRRTYVWRPSDYVAARARLMVHHTGPRRGDDAPHTTAPEAARR